MLELLDRLKDKLSSTPDPGMEANYYKLKKMARTNANFAKTVPHPKYKCRLKDRCAWHSRVR